MKLNNIEQLEVFKLSIKLSTDIYNVTKSFPKEELYGLVSQMRRAVVSIGANLMEGGARNSDGEYKHFIGISRGSASELKCHLIISNELKFISKEQSDDLIGRANQIVRMLTGLLNSVSRPTTYDQRPASGASQ